jgi:hypothetical protein
MFKSLLLSITLLSQSLSVVWASERATPVAPLITTSSEIIAAESGEKIQLEMQAIAPRNLQEDTAAVEYVAKEIATNPQAKVDIIQLTVEGNATATRQQEQMTQAVLQSVQDQSNNQQNVDITRAKIPVSATEKISSRFQGARDLFYKHERVSLSLLRATVNGTIVSVGLIMNTGLPAITAIPIGLLAGSLSGITQYLTPQLQRLLVGNAERNKEIIASSRIGALRVKTFQLVKWYSIEVAFLGLIDGVSYALGAPTGRLNEEVVKLLKSSLMSTASQGVWDSTIANETREDLQRAGSDVERQRRIQMRSNVITFGVSMASVFGAVLSMMGSPIGAWSLAALGATGLLYNAKRWLATREVKLSRPKLVGDCRAVFSGI